MKYFRLISIFFALTLFVGAGSNAHAQSDDTLTPPDVSSQLNQIGQQNTAAFTTQLQQQNQALTQQNLTSNGTLVANPSQSAAPAGANTSTTLKSGATGDPYETFGPLFGFFMEIFAWLLGVAGVLLNDVVLYTVVGMGKFVNSLSAIGISWRVLRDIGNLVLIFGFLAIGISTIIGYEPYGEKRLPMLLVVAVLLNFSLFFAEAIVDVGNIFATQFYTQITGTMPSQQIGGGSGISGNLTTTYNNVYGGVHTKGISNAIVQAVSLQTLYNVNPGQQKVRPGLIDGTIDSITNYDIAITAIFAILLFIIASFVLFSLAFILLARFVMLIFLLVVAPIGFAGLLVPKLEDLARQWWHQLINNTITAPILLLMLYVALAVITDVNFLGGMGASDKTLAGAAAAASQGSAGVQDLASIVLSFLVAMGLLLACVMMAKKLSAFGAGAATKWAGAASFGLAAYGMRGSIGWAGSAGARALRKTRLSRVPVLGRALVGGLDKVGKASFDARGTSGLKKLDIDAGTAQKGGYSEVEKKAIKARETYAKDLKQTGAEERVQKAAEQRKKEAEAAGASKAEIAVISKQIADAKAAPQEKYSAGLVWGPGSFFNRNQKAAKNIKEAARKSKADKNLEKIEKFLEKEDEGGGGEPTPKAASGGEAH